MATSIIPGRLKVFLLSLSFFFSQELLSQQASEVDTFETGTFSNALFASSKPDSQTVGVLLFVPNQNKKSPEAWASLIKQYFEAYGFPVKIFLYDKRYDGTGASALIYVGAKAYQGNLSSGNVSLFHLLDNHQHVFPEIAKLYKIANPNLFDGDR